MLVDTKWAQPFGDGKASDNIVDDLVELSESNSFHKHNKENYPFDISNSFKEWKKILFHSLTIPPDNVSTGMLVAEIADGFKELGVDVEILASSPQYNIENSKNLTSDKYYTSSYKDINITHISSASRSFNKVTRFFNG